MRQALEAAINVGENLIEACSVPGAILPLSAVADWCATASAIVVNGLGFLGSDLLQAASPFPLEMKEGLSLEQARTVAWLEGRVEILKEIASAHLPGDNV